MESFFLSATLGVQVPSSDTDQRRIAAKPIPILKKYLSMNALKRSMHRG